MLAVLKVNGEAVQENIVLHGERRVRVKALHSVSAEVKPVGKPAATRTVGLAALNFRGHRLDEYANVEMIYTDKARRKA